MIKKMPSFEAILHENYNEIVGKIAGSISFLIGYIPAISSSNDAITMRKTVSFDPISVTEQFLNLVIEKRLFNEFIVALNKAGFEQTVSKRYFQWISGPKETTISYPPSPTYIPLQKPVENKYEKILHHNLNFLAGAMAPKIKEIINDMPSMRGSISSIGLLARSNYDPVEVSRELLINHVRIRELWNEFFSSLDNVGLSQVHEFFIAN